MSHLTIDEIIEFVSLREINDESLVLINKVNGHIRGCQKCFELVKAYQIMFEEFECMRCRGTFKSFVLNELQNDKIEQITKQQNGFDIQR